MHTAFVSESETSSQCTPPESIKRETIQIDLKAGLSIIKSIDVKQGDKVWWEIASSGDVGFGVLFKHEQELETIQSVRRVNPSTEDTRYYYSVN